MSAPPPPIGLLAELTHRCPLSCPYCSNPIDLERRSEELDAEAWARIFREAAALGVLQLHLSGGEPAARRDLAEIVAAAAAAGLYGNLITSGVGLDAKRLAILAANGLDHVQLSIQHAGEGPADLIGGYRGGHRRKLAIARAVVELGLPLTLNVVLHRANIGATRALVDLALDLGASRIELAHAQYYAWAARNRDALMPEEAEIHAALDEAEALREQLRGRLAVDIVAPDYFARLPKPCMGGWGRQIINVTPSGKALPCHAAQTIPGLEFWSVKERSLAEIWADSPAFQAFRGEGWMREPCRTCPQRGADFGGCRCQALALTGDARNADPACSLAPHHALIREAAKRPAERPAFSYRAPAPS
jgi:pyrroloquinoline quinone biosynthesis protein E